MIEQLAGELNTGVAGGRRRGAGAGARRRESNTHEEQKNSPEPDTFHLRPWNLRRITMGYSQNGVLMPKPPAGIRRRRTPRVVLRTRLGPLPPPCQPLRRRAGGQHRPDDLAPLRRRRRRVRPRQSNSSRVPWTASTLLPAASPSRRRATRAWRSRSAAAMKAPSSSTPIRKIGRASCRERVSFVV